MVVNEENYIEVMETICKDLTDLMHFFHSSEDNINYFDTQEVIIFQDKLNEFSIEYKDLTKQTNIEDTYKNYEQFIINTAHNMIPENKKEYRDNISRFLTKWFDSKKQQDKIVDFSVVCDVTNNTPYHLDNNEARVTVWWLWPGKVNPVYVDYIFKIKK